MRRYDLWESTRHVCAVYSNAGVEHGDLLRYGDRLYRWDGIGFNLVYGHACAALETMHPEARTNRTIYRIREGACIMVGSVCLRWDPVVWYPVRDSDREVGDAQLSGIPLFGDTLRFRNRFYRYGGDAFVRVSQEREHVLLHLEETRLNGSVYRFNSGKCNTVCYLVQMHLPASIPSFVSTRFAVPKRLNNTTARGTEHAHNTTQGDNMGPNFRQFTRGDVGGYMAICRQWNEDANCYELDIFTPRTKMGNGSILHTCRDALEKEIKESCADTEYLIVTFQDYVNMELRSAL